MKMELHKRNSLILIACILIAAALTAAVYFNGKDKSCDKCEIQFKTIRSYGQALPEPIIISKNVHELYDDYVAGECKIKVDKNRGYYE